MVNDSTNGKDGYNQCTDIVRYMLTGRAIDQRTAILELHCVRLNSRIHDLVKFWGLRIIKEWKSYDNARGNKTRYMTYKIDMKDSMNLMILKQKGLLQ